jgi:hypothetical protein
MIDLDRSSQAQAGRADAPAASSQSGWKTTRERVRDIIRAEVERFHPTDDARYPLELIVEASIRYKEADRALAITVVDDAGQPRTIEKDGQTAAFTIRDLLEEIRQTRPMLFKAAPAPDATAKVYAAPETRRRDWLDLGSGQEPSAPKSPAAQGATPARPGHLRRLRRGKARLHLWTRAAQRRWIAPAMAAGAAKLQAARAELPKTFEPMRGAFEKDRAPSAARGLAIGAVALATVIGIGTFFFIGRDGPAEPVSARSDMADPVATGTVTPAQGPSETAAVAPPTGGRMLRGVPDVIDTATLSLDGEVVRLFGVEWAPGGGKPDDLTQYLRGREVSCEQVKSGDTYRCQVDGQDLSRVVLFNGGGKTTAEATPELKATEEKARTAQTGVWSRQP